MNVRPSPARPIALRCENLTDPLAVDEARPRFSWLMQDERFGAFQSAYELEVSAESPGQPGRAIWTSGKVRSPQSVLVEYRGPKLVPHANYSWRVRLWDHDGMASRWSDRARWSSGLLTEKWSGEWIGLRQVKRDRSTPVRFLRSEFTLSSAPVAARLYATALGLFEAHLNGQKVSADALSPGWTDYRRRVDYVAYDVTEHVTAGKNVLGALLADGWYSGRMAWNGQRRLYGDVPAFSSMLRLVFADGSIQTLRSDTTWQVFTGPYSVADLYDGETLDGRQEPLGWATPGFDASAWQPVDRIRVPRLSIAAKQMPSVRGVETVRAVKLTEPTPGRYIFDYGQNLVGLPRVTLRERRGTIITLRFGEMLNPDGTLYTANLRSARCTDEYTCRGDADEVYQPRFTFHGFRYAELSGLRQQPRLDSVTAVVHHNDLRPTGHFRCSDRLLNRLQENIRWGQRGNYLEAPTDCPQRDERLGWTGDAQVFAGTAAFNYEVSTFFRKWLRDLRDGQLPNGAFPDVAPDVLAPATQKNPERWPAHDWHGNAAWADAGVICPWVMYRRYGDTRILEENFSAMKAWIAFMEKTSRNLVRPATEYGDWLATDAVTPDRAPTPCDLVGTAYFAASTQLVAETARVLNRRAEAKAYDALHGRVVRAFQGEYVTPSGRIVGDTQTSYLLALAFDLLPQRHRPPAVQRLVELIEKHGHRLATGFVGTPLLCPVLSRFGRHDVAYRLLLQRKYPSWLYPVLNGATTMWERWNSWTEKSGFGDVGMNSFNHYAYGAVGEWMYGAVGGLNPEPIRPGFEHFRLQPVPCTALRHARAEFESPRGKIVSAWKLEGRRWRWEVVVPANSRATAVVPAHRAEDVSVSIGSADAGMVKPHGRLEERGVSFELCAGSYVFVVTRPRVVVAERG